MEQELDDLEKSFETSAKWLAAIVVLGLLAASVALAAPRAETALECGVAADMAVVARSLAACIEAGEDMDTINSLPPALAGRTPTGASCNFDSLL